MSDDTHSTPAGGQLRQEAADWFSLMRGPEADERREDFSRWMASSAAHRRAYNSISEKFNLGKGLKRHVPAEPTVERAAPTGHVGPASIERSRGRQTALLGGVLALCLAGGWYGMKQMPPPPSGALRETREDREARFATAIGEIRNFVLLDGSKLTLDTNSIVLASYTQGERGLRLIQGRARFVVARDARPFVVRADTTVVTARETSFDMQLEDTRHVAVHMLDGQINGEHNGQVDVQTQSDPGGAGLTGHEARDPLVTRLMAGQRLLVDGRQVSMAISGMQNDDQWLDGVEAFDDVAVSELVASLNRYARKPVTITDARIGSMRISGTYRLLDTGPVTRKVADLLGLVVTEDDKSYRLHRR